MNFFEESTEQSKVKIAIVAKYFEVWAQIMLHTQNMNIAYVDLFSGPGRYEDGTKSTPIRILEIAIQNNFMRQRLVTIFNDKNKNNTDLLSEEISRLPNIEKLSHYPEVTNQVVGNEVMKLFEQTESMPTFFFVDPWGYKGLSLDLIYSVVKNWGCDCIFFFNYQRINMGLHNDMVREHMDALFGKEGASELRRKLIPLNPEQRELTIIEHLCSAIKKLGLKYVLPFRFKDDRGTRSSHHLIFVSKKFLGYEKMKEIMAKESSGEEQGVANFEYNPIDKKIVNKQQLLFELSRPLDDLKDMLLEAFSGQTIKMNDIYMQHSINRPYTKKNYKDTLKQLEEQGKIQASPHKKGTFGDNVLVKFPDRIKSKK